MDHAQRGAKALESKDFEAAVKHYSAAIVEHPRSPDYYVKRSAAYTRILPANYQLALGDADIAILLAKERGKREIIGQSHLRRAIALYNMERFADAKNCFQWAKRILPKDNSISIWESKTNDKLSELDADDERGKPHVKEFPDIDLEKALSNTAELTTEAEKKEQSVVHDTTAANADGRFTQAAAGAPAKAEPTRATPADKIRHEWYQSSDKVTFSLMAKGVPKDKALVEIQRGSLTISFPLATGSDYSLSIDPFYAPVDPATSSYRILSTKVEVILAKAKPGHKWHDLEGSSMIDSRTEAGEDREVGQTEVATAPAAVTSGPSYPTSSKYGTKDWDRVADEMIKKPKQNDKEDGPDEDSDEGGDAVNSFFKKLYKNADPDTRRAMMKSYQESNGTALSTNWSEVKQGKVTTDPPEGMIAKKWGE